MFLRIYFFLFLFYGCLLCPVILIAQANTTQSKVKKKKAPFSPSPLFKDDEVLHFKLVGKLNSLFNDRGDKNSSHPILLQYKDKDSLVSIHLMVKTRGYFRRDKSMCKLPPLMLNFLKENKLKNTVFQKQNKLKLVVPCQGDDYVIREWLVYKLYNLISPKSFKARLAQVEFEDSLMKRKTETRYCFLLEDEKEVAKRNSAFVWDQTKVTMTNTDKSEFKKMAVFQFMIGNTDWSVPFLQNIKLIKTDTTKPAFTIPYDFDHAGIVDAPYALPAEELEMSTVQERRYRGYCEADKTAFAEVFALFNSLKTDIYNVYTNCSLLDAKYIKFVTRYLDDFYKIINNNKAIEEEFGHPCRQEQRIEIKGLKER
ncbi:MAG: hypothetical protein ABJA71_01470 [Ginsengibacter sp.]